MNAEEFVEAVQAMSDEDLQSLQTGDRLYLHNDHELMVGAEHKAARLNVELGEDAATPQTIRQALVDQAESLIEQHYRENPLSQPGFNQQVLRLVQEHGAENFAAGSGQRARYTLFVEGGEILRQQAGDARYPYGSFLELHKEFDAAERAKLVIDWIESGEAYQQYLSMNVCRYNC